jgi:hypothetical protein
MLAVGIAHKSGPDARTNLAFALLARPFADIGMGRHKLFYKDSKTVRDSLNLAIEMAHVIHQNEKDLVEQLHRIDRERFYVRYGYKSLTGFCRESCGFSKTQAQRIVTRVRRFVPTDKIVDRQSGPKSPAPVESTLRLGATAELNLQGQCEK